LPIEKHLVTQRDPMVFNRQLAIGNWQ